MSRIIHFEIPADHPERLVEFYGNVFGWRFQKWEEPIAYWLMTTGEDGSPGINGGMQPRESPGDSVRNVIGVVSIDASIEKLKKQGAEIVMPKMAVPGVGWAAYFKDPDGNVFGMMQDDPNAK